MKKRISKYSTEFARQVYDSYKDWSVPVSEISKKFGIPLSAILFLMKREGYPLRPRGFQVGNRKGEPCTDLLRYRILWFKKHAYLRRAKRKKIKFDLTDDEFIHLITSNCHYCGKSSKDEKRTVNGKEINILTIDRINSSKGYTSDNCVPACKVCNTIKMDLGYDEFYRHLRTILLFSGPTFS